MSYHARPSFWYGNDSGHLGPFYGSHPSTSGAIQYIYRQWRLGGLHATSGWYLLKQLGWKWLADGKWKYFQGIYIQCQWAGKWRGRILVIQQSCTQSLPNCQEFIEWELNVSFLLKHNIGDCIVGLTASIGNAFQKVCCQEESETAGEGMGITEW